MLQLLTSYVLKFVTTPNLVPHREHCRESTNSQIGATIAHLKVFCVVLKNCQTGTTVAHLQYTKFQPT
jgi:hypothetical protein